MAIPRVAVYPSHMRKFDIPVRTFTDRDDPTAGYIEADLAAHNGGSTTGSRVHSLAHRYSSGCIKCVALVAREQPLAVNTSVAAQSPILIPLLGIDIDNEGLSGMRPQ